MSSLVDKFAELEQLLRQRREELALHTGVPFVLLIYDPYEERQCRREQTHLANKLQDAGIKVHEISIETFMFKHYEGIGLLKKMFEKERAEPAVVYQDLAKNTRPALSKQIIQVAEQLEGTDAVLFLTQAAHLYPFVRVSNLLEELENFVRVPLVIFYPGEELDGELRFLCLENADGPHTKYRARRI